MGSDRDRALRLLEQEDRRNEEIAARRAEQEQEGRLQDAIERVREQRRRERVAARAREAKQEAADLVPEIERARKEADDALAQLMRSVNEVEQLEQKRASLLQEAGESAPEPIDRELTWWLHSHLRSLTELDREQQARVTLRGEPAPFPLAG